MKDEMEDDENACNEYIFGAGIRAIFDSGKLKDFSKEHAILGIIRDKLCI